MHLQLAIDCQNPERLVAFWGPLLDYRPAPPPAGHDSWNSYYLSCGVPEAELAQDGDSIDRLCDPTGQGPDIWFQIVPEEKAVKNRLHLDLLVTDRGRTQPLAERQKLVDEKAAQAVALGATVVKRYPGDLPEIDDPSGYSVTLHDVEGNEFCIA